MRQDGLCGANHTTNTGYSAPLVLRFVSSAIMTAAISLIHSTTRCGTKQRLLQICQFHIRVIERATLPLHNLERSKIHVGTCSSVTFASFEIVPVTF